MRRNFAKKSSYRSRRARSDRRTRLGRGSVLILTLWLMLLLSLFAVALAQGIMQKAHVAKNIQQREELRYTAEAGLKQAIAKLRFRDPKTFSHKDRASAERFMDFSGRVGTMFYSLADFGDENSKLNVNYCQPDELRRLLETEAHLGAEEAERLAYAVKDFIDEDDHITKYFDKGSERFSYQLAGLAHAPKNRPLEFISELLLVRGMTAGIFEAIRPDVTVYGDDKVNVNTADAQVLTALGLLTPVVEQLLIMRRGPDGTEGTDDDFVFENAATQPDE